MKITLLNRKYNPKERSIERLFSFIKKGLSEKRIDYNEIECPYNGGLINLFKSILFFRRKIKSDEKVHITGHIHFAAVLLKTKNIIITVHDLGLYRNLSPFRFFIFKFFWIYLPFKRAKVITVISEKTGEEIVKMMPSVKRKIKVIPNCITLEIEERNFIKHNKLTRILIIGTRSNKNVERAIIALKGLPIFLTIVGELSSEQENLLLSQKIDYENKSGINEQELLDTYKSVDVLLFPSLYEGFGLPILEAQAQNVLVITSEISPLKEVAGGAAILVNPKEISSINMGVKKILALTHDEKLNLLERGKENLKKYYISTIVDEYFNLYCSL
ncbi:glycosyltransferase [Capnocytophaga canimorsus]|uniref:glycosyltransferase n=1 Tax=Capnocytophaga canimorsus TaxID=28188 RepID=UPI00385BCC9C